MSDLELRAQRPSDAEVRESTKPASNGWRARWVLARWWMGRFTLSFLTTAVLTVLFGLLLGLFLDGEVRQEDLSDLSADLLFLLLLANLAVNWTSTGYVFVGDDSFSGRVSFLRSLPTSARDVVGMRLLVLLATLLVMAPLVFLPPYLIFGSIGETFGPYRYLCFVLLWASYGLISGCANAYLELGFRARNMLLVQMVWSFSLAAIVLVVNALGGGVVEGSVRLLLPHATPVAALALVVAAGVTCLWYRLAQRRLRRRELLL